MLKFEAEGEPRPQGSKKAIPHVATGRTILIDVDAKNLKEWRRLVAVAAAKAVAWSGGVEHFQADPMAIEIVFYMPRPKSHFGTGRNAGVLKPSAPPFPSRKPDVDKLARAVLDALTTLVWKDDAQVIDLRAQKLYADGFRPGAHVSVGSVFDDDTD